MGPTVASFSGVTTAELAEAATETRRRLGPAARIRLETTSYVEGGADGDVHQLELLWTILVRRNKKFVIIGAGHTWAAAISSAAQWLARKK